MPAAPSLAAVLAEAIADVEGVDPVELDFQLYHELDVDALDALVLRSGSAVSVRTTVAGHEVTIHDADRIEVDGRTFPAAGG